MNKKEAIERIQRRIDADLAMLEVAEKWDGDNIECFLRYQGLVWVENINPEFNSGMIYRIKPEPKMIPLKDLSVLYKQDIVNKSNGDKIEVIGISQNVIYTGLGAFSRQELFNKFTYLDGSIIGEVENL